MEYIIGIDDTDNLESRGTGHLARSISKALARDFDVQGVTRHQLLEDPRVPKTAKNSCAAILFDGERYPLEEIGMHVRKLMMDDFQPGSDPGLCVASRVPFSVIIYGKSVKRKFIQQATARQVAAENRIFLEGLGGNEDGVIGALAAVGLAAQGNDGRYVLVGSIRDLNGLQPIESVLHSGVSAVRTLGGQIVEHGKVLAEKMRPARRGNKPVLLVEPQDGYWAPLKVD